MALAVELEAAWLCRPDIVAKLMPSKRWKLSHVDMRPAMFVKARFDVGVCSGRCFLCL